MGLGKKFKKKLKKVERGIRKPVKKVLKKTEQVLRKPIKRGFKSLKKTVKEVALPIAITVVTGDTKNVHDVVKIITTEVIKKNVTKEVLKKTNDVKLSQVVGTLSGIGAENLYEKIRINNQVETLSGIRVENLYKKEKIQEQQKEPKIQSYEKKITNQIQELDTKLSINLDSGKPNISASKSYGNESVNGVLTVSNDSLSVSSSMKLDDITTVGNHVNVTKNSLSGGISVKNKNVENSYSVAVRKNGFWNSEVGVEHSHTTKQSTDVMGVCVSKRTYKQDIRVPLCGKVGTVEQNVKTCPGKVTVTNYKGFNTKGAVCGGAVATATVFGGPIVIAAAGETAVATAAIIAGTTVTVNQ
jgi:hypothetical protein